MNQAVINCTMSIRPTCPLAFRAFNRPTSILAKPHTVPRVKAALLGIRIHNLPKFASYHPTASKLKQGSHKRTRAPYRNPSHLRQPQAPTDAEMETDIRNFASLGVDEKLTAIQDKKNLIATDLKKTIPSRWRDTYRLRTQRLDLKEKEIRDVDYWYKKAFRKIAWAPTILKTILINVIIAFLP